MSFGIYAIQFYVQSSLPLLRRFLLVSLCYITIVKRINPNSKEDMELLREVLRNNHFDDEDE